MRKWDELASAIQGYNPQAYEWPTELSPEVRQRLKKVETTDRWLLRALNLIICSMLTDDEKENRLRFILAERGILIANTSLDYTLNPRSPVNQACLKIAEFIAKKDEPVCRILMPSIKKIIGTSPSPENLQAASTDIEDRFILTNFLISADGQALIALEDIIEHSAHDTHLFFSDDRHQNSILYLANQDRARIHQINKRYFDQLEEIHRIKEGKKPSIGWALNELKNALLRASVAGVGAETAVNVSECREPVFAFYRTWRNIPFEIKNRIKHYTVNGGTYTLESYLLRLFVNLKEDATDIDITEAEYRRVIQENIFPCAHQIGQSLDSLLAHNPNLMTLPLPNREADFNTLHLPDKDVLVQLQKQTIEELANRSIILGSNDQLIISHQLIISILIKNIGGNHYILRDNIMDLYSRIKNLGDLTDALLLIPKSEWRFFLLGLKAKKINILRSMPPQDFYLSILNVLPSDDWATFFSVLEYALLTVMPDGHEFGMVLNGLSATQWNDFKEATAHLISRVLRDANQIALLFLTTSTTAWKSLYQTLKQFIEPIISDATSMGQLFAKIATTYWSNLRDTVSLPFQTILQHPNALKQFLLALSPNARSHFIENISGFNEDTPITVHFIKVLIDMLNPYAMKKVTAQLNAKRVWTFFSDGENMALLLQQFSTKEWGTVSKFFTATPTANFYGKLFANTPMNRWYDLACFYRYELNVLHVFNQFIFSDLLAIIEPSLRPRLFRMLIPSFSLYTLTPQTFFNLIKIFNQEDWLFVATLIKNNRIIGFNTSDYLTFFNLFEHDDRRKIAPVMVQTIININIYDPASVSCWQSAYQGFSKKINQFLAEPIHVAFMFYSMPTKDWSDLSWLMRAHLQRQLSITSFLDALLSIFQSSEKVQLLNAFDFCLNQVTPNNMAVIFKSLPVETWPQIAVKLRYDKMRTPFFQSTEELGQFLNQFNTEVLPIVYTLFQKIIDPLLQLPHTFSVLSRTLTLSTWQALMPLIPIQEEMHQPSIRLMTPEYQPPSNSNTLGFFRTPTPHRPTRFSDPANETPRNDRR